MLKKVDNPNSLPLRYDTLVEENGNNSSGGQKQRLSIARAILKNPDILVMDEATSNLDSITEKAISDTMDEFMKDKTALIIAHRLSTIKDCDRIYVLKNGEVIEEGARELFTIMLDRTGVEKVSRCITHNR